GGGDGARGGGGGGGAGRRPPPPLGEQAPRGHLAGGLALADVPDQFLAAVTTRPEQLFRLGGLDRRGHVVGPLVGREDAAVLVVELPLVGQGDGLDRRRDLLDGEVGRFGRAVLKVPGVLADSSFSEPFAGGDRRGILGRVGEAGVDVRTGRVAGLDIELCEPDLSGTQGRLLGLVPPPVGVVGQHGSTEIVPGGYACQEV